MASDIFSSHHPSADVAEPATQEGPTGRKKDSPQAGITRLGTECVASLGFWERPLIGISPNSWPFGLAFTHLLYHGKGCRSANPTTPPTAPELTPEESMHGATIAAHHGRKVKRTGDGVWWAAGYKAAHDKVAALHIALVSVQARRDTDGTRDYPLKAKPLKLLALPRGLEPLFSP